MLQVVIQVLLVLPVSKGMLSDGKYFSRIVLIKNIHSLVTLKQLHCGVVVQMTNYITQPLDGSKQELICLDISVVGMF
jgi:hypothetical protein